MDFHEQGIAVIRVGGLGNQLFQVCSAFVVSKYNNCPLYITDIKDSDNPHNKFNNDYKKSIFRYFNTELIIDNYTFINHGVHNCFNKWNPLEITKGTIMNDYYGQYYPTLEPFEDEIRGILLKGINNISNDILKTNYITTNSIFIHIRRGDYVENSHKHYLQSISYYEKAYNYIKTLKTIENVYILSDDIEWVKEQKFFQELPNKIFWENKDELYSITLMSLCKGGAICANSSFSWWGAFLGTYSIRNPVVVPSRWISVGIVDLFPKEWIII